LLSRRLAQHVSDYKRFKNGKYDNIASFQIIEKGNYDISLIESYPCDSKDELHQREKYYITNVDCINKNIPARSKKEYLEKAKQYYYENKERTVAIKNTKITCCCGSIHRKGELSRHSKTQKHINFIYSQNNI
jgi:hypothetical protein